MNERIKELAKEARLLTGWTVGECEYQKFAELIVWECFLIGAKYIQSNNDVSKFERNLKGTFGVDNE